MASFQLSGSAAAAQDLTSRTLPAAAGNKGARPGQPFGI